ncbi:MAG: aldo/keto reductase, partial [Bryobacterales bacterium]|nr:aldo/keto reductase [Bryobacterales bacterium]
MKRRIFVGTAVTGLSAGQISAQLPTGGDIPKRAFGKTGEKLTVIGQAGGRFPLMNFEEASAIVRRAYDLGVNYFDNARVYWDGRSEEVYGAVLPPFRKKV